MLVVLKTLMTLACTLMISDWLYVENVGKLGTLLTNENIEFLRISSEGHITIPDFNRMAKIFRRSGKVLQSVRKLVFFFL